MSEGQESTNPSDTGDAEAFKLMASFLKSQIASDMKKEKEKEAALVVPAMDKKGFQVQVGFNVEVLRILMAEPETEGILAAIEKLKERNTLLIHADKNPSLLESYDMAVQIKNAQGKAQDSLSTILLAKSLASSSQRKRKYPFQQRGATEQRVAPHETQLSSVRNDIASLRQELSLQQSSKPSTQFSSRGRAPGNSRTAGIVQCFFCHQFGHIAPRCPNKW